MKEMSLMTVVTNEPNHFPRGFGRDPEGQQGFESTVV